MAAEEAWRVSPEGVGRRRIDDLRWKRFRSQLTAAERSELEKLEARYPPVPPDDPLAPFYKEIEKHLVMRGKRRPEECHFSVEDVSRTDSIGDTDPFARSRK